MQPTKLFVFDFDGTLYSSRGAPKGRQDTAWYYHARSLDPWQPPGYDKRWHMNIVMDARRATITPGAISVLVTARPSHNQMRKKLKNMLASAGVGMHGLILKPVPTVMTDPQFKARAVINLIQQLPTVRQVVMYDDNDANLEAVGSSVKGTNREFTGVKTPGFLFP